jgi:hypothetical protein
VRACPTISCSPLQGGAIVVDIKPDELIDAKDRLNFAGTVQYFRRPQAAANSQAVHCDGADVSANWF